MFRENISQQILPRATLALQFPPTKIFAQSVDELFIPPLGRW
jgi:hypothetical protein